jgi:hypothetical protein
MARSAVGDERAYWYGRVTRFVNLTGHLEQADLIWKAIEADIGACTQAYLCKDLAGWNHHLTRIRLYLDIQKGPIECRPMWC